MIYCFDTVYHLHGDILSGEKTLWHFVLCTQAAAISNLLDNSAKGRPVTQTHYRVILFHQEFLKVQFNFIYIYNAKTV